MNNKNILVVVPTLQAGGMERAAVNTAQEFRIKGNKVTFFILLGGDVFYDIPEDIKILYGKKNVTDKLRSVKSLWRLRRWVRNNHPDIILSFSGMHSCYVLLATVFLKLRIFVLHRSNPYITYSKLNNWLNRHLFPLATALVVQTEKSRSVFKEKYPKNNIILYPNVVRSLNSIHIDYDIHNIVTVTRLVNGKGLANLIRIFATVHIDDWKLTIVGDGPLKDTLNSLIQDLNVSDFVRILGFQKDVDSYLEKASVFAFASESEGFPNALLEAMCQGLACISFDCPTGPSDMISDGKNGYLVPLYDNEQYSSKLTSLMRSRNLRSTFGERARQLVKRHRPEVVINKFMTDLNSYCI